MAEKKFSFFPTVKADEEDLIDPHTTLRDKCKEDKRAQELYTKYMTCNDRVNSKKQTSETCMEELLDYVAFVDHCAAKNLFSKLK